MNTKNITKSNNPALAGSLPALRRSAARARQIAEQTGTRLVVLPPAPTPKAKVAAKTKRCAVT
jgi:hypothetical protein